VSWYGFKVERLLEILPQKHLLGDRQSFYFFALFIYRTRFLEASGILLSMAESGSETAEAPNFCGEGWGSLMPPEK
jgi:hypothetical protein